MTLLKKPAGEPGSRSRCPAHYKRPRVLVLHSRGARPGLLARYVGGQLALGGYADVDVRPWRDGGAALPEAAAAPPADAGVKDLRAFLARRGASAPRGAAEKADLRAACVHAAARPRVVLWAADAMSARGEVLDPADLRVHHLGPDAALLGTCDLVLACVAGKDAGECGACLAPLLAGGGAPVIHLACDPGDHVSAFEAAFADKARPASAGSIAVAGALLLEVGARHRDGALVQLGGRGLALERLDAARADAGLGKFYDLLSTSGLPLVFERRARLARLAWGHALLYAPLLAAHAACGGALPAAARATAAAASRGRGSRSRPTPAARRGTRRARRSRRAGARRAPRRRRSVRGARGPCSTARPRSRPPWRSRPRGSGAPGLRPSCSGSRPARSVRSKRPTPWTRAPASTARAPSRRSRPRAPRTRAKRSRRCGARSGTCGSQTNPRTPRNSSRPRAGRAPSLAPRGARCGGASLR